jgi:hypothetical protein
MKIYQFIVLLGLIIYTNSTCYSISVESKKTCHNAAFSNVELIAGYKYCCHGLYTAGQSRLAFCKPVTQSQYDNIESFMQDLQKEGYNNLSFDCKSHYLEFGLLSLLLLLL